MAVRSLLERFRELGVKPCEAHEMMVVVAHPDDETIGLGSHLSAIPGVTIVHATDGAPYDGADAEAHGLASRQAYAAARRHELEAAMAEAGIAATSLVAIGLVDQQAARHLPALSRRLAELFEGNRTRLVFTHAYEGGHPDHDAVCFAVHAAARLLRARRLEPPAVLEMPLYRAGRSGMVAQDFVGAGAPAIALELDSDAWAAKQRMLACHSTQAKVLAAFAARVEKFRVAPTYDFGVLPNGGDLYYERFSWGIDGATWLQLAQQALLDLGLPA